MRISLCQMDSLPGEIGANVEATVSQLHEAAAEGAELAVLPELITTSWPAGRTGAESLAEEFGASRAVRAWSRVASSTGMWVVGGFIERDGGRIYNAVAVVSPSGPVGRYRKLHLFGAETRTFDLGDTGIPVFEMPVGGRSVRLGIAVCYDLRFPEVLRILAMQGADVVAVPTGWVTGFDEKGHHEDGMTPQGRAAAIQANLSQVYLAIADRIGTDVMVPDPGSAGRRDDARHGSPPGGRRQSLTFLGASCLVDPFGAVVAGPASPDIACRLSAEVDLDRLEQARERGTGINPRAQRRTDVYGDLLGYDPARWRSAQDPALPSPPPHD